MNQIRISIIDSLTLLGSAFLQNDELCLALQERRLMPLSFHRQLQYLLYRLLFVLIAERKGLLNRGAFNSQCSRDSLWDVALGTGFEKVESWTECLNMMQAMWKGYIKQEQSIPCLDTDLWNPAACRDLICRIPCNELYTDALTALIGIETDFGVPFQSIQPRDISAAYESLLALVPSINFESKTYTLSVQEGNERKSTGSYYTPEELVDRVLQSTLIPACAQALQGVPKTQQESVLLNVTVCDPSCGSGNFLVAAARLLASKLTDIRMANGSDRDVLYQQALKDVLGNCVYGLDLNPLTVEICKVVLWLELGMPNQSFSIFTGSIQCGNAILGATPELITKGIQTEYFELIPQYDDRNIRNAIAKKNRLELKGTESDTTHGIEWIPISSEDRSLLLADSICASLVWPKVEGWEYAPTHKEVQQIRTGRCNKNLLHNIKRLKNKYRFCHWHLAFPRVFAQGGFDVVIGNPPYLASRYLSKHQPYQRRAIPKLYTTASGNWDIYIPFTELAVRILKPNGYQAYVTPNKIIGAEYASTLQQEVFFRQTMLEVHDYSRLNLFNGANVAVVIVVNQKRESSANHPIYFYHYKTSVLDSRNPIIRAKAELQCLPAGFISFPVTTPDQSLLQWIQVSLKVSDSSHVSDGLSTDQAYKIAKHVQQGSVSDLSDTRIIKLVNTGTIDPFHLQWGEKKIKFLGFEGTYPVVERPYLTKKYPKRERESAETTVGIAGLSTKIEAAVLPEGVLSGVATVLLKPFEDVCPYALSAVLNTKLYSDLYRALFGMSGMTADVLNYSSRQVAQLPLPNKEYLKPYVGDILELHHIEKRKLTDGLLSLLGQFGHQHIETTRDVRFKRHLEQSVLNALNLSLSEQ